MQTLTKASIERLYTLLDSSLDEALSADEHSELSSLVSDPEMLSLAQDRLEQLRLIGFVAANPQSLAPAITHFIATDRSQFVQSVQNQLSAQAPALRHRRRRSRLTQPRSEAVSLQTGPSTASALLLCLGLVLVVVFAREPMKAHWHHPDEGVVAVESGQHLVGPGALVLSDGSTVQFDPSTQGHITDLKSLDLDLFEGRVSVRAEPQRSGNSIRITTPHSRVTVLGTTFEVAIQGSITSIVVDEGQVAVRDNNGRAACTLRR